MTQKEKDLLLKDLCARLPYGVKCSFISSKGDVPSTIVKVDIENGTVSHIPDGQTIAYFHWIESGYIKPYLRPMSSMTKKERKELSIILNYEFYVDDDFALAAEDDRHRIRLELCEGYIDWLNENHFDYRGLIEKGLAIEVTEKNNPYV